MNEEKQKLYQKWHNTHPQFFEGLSQKLALEAALLIENQQLFNEQIDPADYTKTGRDTDLELVARIFAKTILLNHIEVHGCFGPAVETPCGIIQAKTRRFDAITSEKTIEEIGTELAKEINDEFLNDLSVNCGSHVFVDKVFMTAEAIDTKICELSNVIKSKGSEPTFLWTDYAIAEKTGWKIKTKLDFATQYEDVHGLAVYASDWKSDNPQIIIGSPDCYYYCPYVMIAYSSNIFMPMPRKAITRYGKRLSSANGFGRISFVD